MYHKIIFNNTVQCMSVVLRRLSQLELSLSPGNEEHAAPIIINANPTWMDQESLPHVMTPAFKAREAGQRVPAQRLGDLFQRVKGT